MVKWIERFPGHFYLDILTEGYDVHVCARGGNWMRPVAMVGPTTDCTGVLFHEPCATLEEAQAKAVEAYRAILTQALAEIDE